MISVENPERQERECAELPRSEKRPPDRSRQFAKFNRRKQIGASIEERGDDDRYVKNAHVRIDSRG